MSDHDPQSKVQASASGIEQCLNMLAEEAASARLYSTLLALRHALETCSAERRGTTPPSRIMGVSDRQH